MSLLKLSRINTLLLIAIILVNAYVIALPWLPGVLFWIQKRDGAAVQRLTEKVEAAPAATESRPNQLIIPAMVLEQPIFEGKDSSTLNKGLWRRPLSSTPDKGGNTVIVGHRFTYTNPRGTLYHLDKVKPGDQLGLIWNNQTYVYTIAEIRVVNSQETSIEAPTTQSQVTIYTCTPLWLPKDRLVIIGRQSEP